MGLLENISVYPNPSSGIFSINYERARNIEIDLKIVDVLGNVIHSKKLPQSEMTVDLSTEKSGYYFLVLENGDFVKSIKLNLVK